MVFLFSLPGREELWPNAALPQPWVVSAFWYGWGEACESVRMSFSILTNISAMNTQQNLLNSSNAVAESMQRLSLGPADQHGRG
jgi:hypothetical protein